MEMHNTKRVGEMLDESQRKISMWCREGKFPNTEKDKPSFP